MIIERRGKRCLMDSSSILRWPPFFVSQKTRCETGWRPASPRTTFACRAAAMGLDWRIRRSETRIFVPLRTSAPFIASLRRHSGDGKTSANFRARTDRFSDIPSFGESEPLETRLSSLSAKRPDIPRSSTALGRGFFYFGKTEFCPCGHHRTALFKQI